MAVLDLLSGLASIKWVHFMPTMETSTASAERNMLSTITALVTWSSAETAEVKCCLIDVSDEGAG